MILENSNSIVEREVNEKHRDTLACYENSNEPCNLSSSQFFHLQNCIEKIICTQLTTATPPNYTSTFSELYSQPFGLFLFFKIITVQRVKQVNFHTLILLSALLTLSLPWTKIK